MNPETELGEFCCESCYNEIKEQRKVIHNYSYKPEPIFIIGKTKDCGGLKDKIFTGIEQEVECGENSTQDIGASLVNKFTKKNKWFYLKSDGSLSNGFELVTHPANLHGHYDLPWHDVNKFYTDHNVKSDSTTTCGLHIHTNKDIMDDNHQKKLAYFINSQRDNMEHIARRAASRWAKFKRANHPIESIHKSSGEKYEALNWLPPQTVEFRLFKGTINSNIVLASIEFVHSAIMFTQSVDNINILKNTTEAWKRYIDYVSGDKDYKYLLNYLQERGLV